FVLAVALAACEMLGGAHRAHAGITAIETNLDNGGWVSLASAAGSSVGPVSANLGGGFGLMNMSAIAFPPAELASSNLVLTTMTGATHSIKIVVASTDFKDPGVPLLKVMSTVGGTAINSAAGSSVTFQSFVDPGNHSDHTGEAGAFTPGLQLTNFPTGSTA